ncbi:PTS transporter subunit EIIC [Serratia marcescens]|uniref:PTS transporter subunit EIIC n=1 Tax=Serratia marcescens TaxID=615 RepID=UPI0039EA2874
MNEALRFSQQGMVTIFGLSGAALAFYHTAKPGKRKVLAKAILDPRAITTSILVGITEPIEFTFLFYLSAAVGDPRRVDRAVAGGLQPVPGAPLGAPAGWSSSWPITCRCRFPSPAGRCTWSSAWCSLRCITWCSKRWC